MRKIFVVASALILAGVVGASAQDFHVSEPDSGPDAFVSQSAGAYSVDRSVTTSSVGATGNAGFSAAQGFGPSDQDNLPAPRFQIAR
ncbi:hypothetical protein [Nitratireductor thuwali]|uniref:DUF680 domain-containing protein n=1 Tax=Nitratireductor thuwali TaxID=2267699 RepID=A0ABY5MME4_9HYPH|nr:hypothetical protein NTH_02278 [Nitratireductor thuwali]